MPGDIFFSIIIPTFNRASVIKKTIDTALNQTYHSYEVIIVDDGGTDNTEEVIRAINNSRIVYYKKENAERAAARNFGAAKTKGDYITFLDSDDLLHPGYLEVAKDCIKKNNAPPFVYVAHEIRNDAGKLLAVQDHVRTGAVDFLVDGNPLSCLGVFVKKDVWTKFQFNEDRNLTASEDWELWLRIVANFGITADARVSATMVYHDNRSVLETDEHAMATRKQLAIAYAFRDAKVREVYGRYKARMQAYGDSYIALHLALAGKSKRSIRYLLRAAGKYPPILFSRRCMAIVKNLF
jgi:glycosyltransferase involved in cell wall biosynthesis